jgi:hypothetical protein
MEQSDDKVFSTILSYLPSKSLQILTSSGIASDMMLLSQDNLFWKYGVETLLGKYLILRKINWKKVYLIISMSLRAVRNPTIYPRMRGQKTLCGFRGIYTLIVMRPL